MEINTRKYRECLDDIDMGLHMTLIPCRRRIAVAMSGGVDSSIAAAVLRNAGCDVIGITLLFSDEKNSAGSPLCLDCGTAVNPEADVEHAKEIAEILSFKHYVLDCSKQFEELILLPAWYEYSRGRTPNPCIVCNKLIKFGLFMEYAQNLGAELIATGHHARIQWVYRENERQEWKLLRGKDQQKDQSYFLSFLDVGQLSRSIFPIGNLTKEQVRDMAESLKLPNSRKPESQDVCLFKGKKQFSEILRQKFNAKPRKGLITDTDGKILGSHTGIHQFTIGQRKGLGISLGSPAYVLRIDPESNNIIVGTDKKELYSEGLLASGIHMISPSPLPSSFEADIKIRYLHKPVKSEVNLFGDHKAVVKFSEPQKAVTPGQVVAFYDNDSVLGAGWIDAPLRDV